MPDDSSINYKHYLYGSLKKKPMKPVFADAGYWIAARFFLCSNRVLQKYWLMMNISGRQASLCCCGLDEA